jgi:uncharacterized protein (DUF1015 family)
MKILPYNRVVRDLHGHTPRTFLAALAARVGVSEGGSAAPRQKGHIAMRLAGTWHTLDVTKAARGTNAVGATALDVDVLEREVLAPLLGIADVRTDKRIEFVGGIRGTAELERLVDSDAFAVAFSMYPVSLDDLMRIADAGGIMPPKSTWFEPKLRDGLLSHVIA